MEAINLSTNIQPVNWYSGVTLVASGSLVPGANVTVPFGCGVDSVNFPLGSVSVRSWVADGVVLITDTGSSYIPVNSPGKWHLDGQAVGWVFVIVMIFAWAIRRGLNPSLPHV